MWLMLLQMLGSCNINSGWEEHNLLNNTATKFLEAAIYQYVVTLSEYTLTYLC